MTQIGSVDPANRDEIVRLQLALTTLIPGPHMAMVIGDLGPLTQKAIRFYQSSRNLPVTGQPDEATLQKINEELQERGLTV